MRSFVAIGDSFTEGVGDDLPDGSVRGWADLAAVGIATASGEPVRYANLAIRGRKLRGILDEQLAAAIALRPDIISINGGGNDLMRPRVTIEWVSGSLQNAVRHIVDAGITPVILSGANPSAVVPAGGLMQRRGDALARAVRTWAGELDAPVVDNWSDATLREPRFWSEDRLHLNTVGHARAASSFLAGLGLEAPPAWRDLEAASTAERARDLAYYRAYVLPWIGRRLTGRSSGDGRLAKHPTFVEVAPLRA